MGKQTGMQTRVSRRQRCRWLAGLLVGAAALLFEPCALATVRCVATLNGGKDANDYGLLKAFDDANQGPEGGTWEIRLRPGVYQLTDQLLFLPDGDKDNKAFYMSGGWDATCSSQTGLAHGTVVRSTASTAQNPGKSFLFLGNNSRYDFENLRFENFSFFAVDDTSCPPYNICPDTDAVVIEHVEFDNGEKVTIVVQDARRLTFRGNLVTNMKPINPLYDTIDFAPVGILVRNNEDAPQIAFNTFANITCAGTPGGVMIGSANPQAAIHHNIFQTTGCPSDLYIDTQFGGQTLTPYYNLLLSADGAVGGNLVSNGNVINFNPGFSDAFNGNFRLGNGSPAINKGETLIGAIQDGFIISSADLDGTLRPIGTRFDIGAYESGSIDGTPAVLTVNTKDDVDNGDCTVLHCSLREAINKANGSAGTAQRIAFNIPGSCPQVIVLDNPAGALPDINDSVWINGSSQPGSVQNDRDVGSDAEVCILIAPGGSMTHAIAVPATAAQAVKLTVDGVGFGQSFYGFSTAAIELRSGTGHKISGNVFGGYLPPGNNSTQVGNLGRAIYASGTATKFTIGGPANADRNYFGSMSQNGIVMNSAANANVLIQNNYIGVQPNGLAAQANSGDGISISGGTNGTIIDNAICASDSGIALLGTDVTGFKIQRNNIGVNAAGYGVASHANAVGISIGLGSNNHVIGAAPLDDLQTGTYSNYIDNNDGDGISISSNVSNSTIANAISIRGNLIEGNGRSGSGVGIDLGGSKTQLANDAGDADGGANTLQNYPMIKGTKVNGALTLAVRSVLNTQPNQSLRIDLYYGDTCSPAKGANATTLVGSADVNSGASGVVDFSATIADPVLPGFLTATATNIFGHTSELAPCVRSDTIFVDGYQKPGL